MDHRQLLVMGTDIALAIGAINIGLVSICIICAIDITVVQGDSLCAKMEASTGGCFHDRSGIRAANG